MEKQGRRTFLGVCLGGLAAVAAGVTAWPVFRYLAPASSGTTARTVAIPEGDVAPGEAKFFQYAGSSAVLVRLREGEPVAFSAVCTHLGCIVQWEKDKQTFLCPCHAGRYDAAGRVIAGPPPRPLTRLPLRVADGTITIGEGA